MVVAPVRSVNHAHHRLALGGFLVIVLAHWAEHLVQAYQIWVLGWARPQSRGVLGQFLPWLVTSEWMHYGYALVMLAGLFLLRPGFVGRARTWWTVALVIQFWHHIEHFLLLLQAQLHTNFFGAAVPTSILQLIYPRVELHLFYNSVGLPADDHRDVPAPSAERAGARADAMQLCAYAGAPDRRTGLTVSRRTRLIVAAVLVLLPLGWLVAVTDRAPTVRLMDSSPADAQSLATAPGEARLNLSAAADPALSHLTVVDSAGRRVDAGAVTAGPGDVLRVPVRIDANGTYTVGYHVIGVAGGQTSGVIRFAVGARASTDAHPAAGHEHGVDGLSATLLLINLIAVIVVVTLLVRRPAPRRAPPQ